MSELIDSSPEKSPDFLAETKGEAARRVNRLPIVIVTAVSMIALMVFAYEGHQRSLEDQRAAAREAEVRRVSAAVPPIKQPPGPDVLPVAFAQEAAPVAMPGQAPVLQDQEAQQARAKKLAEFDAALKASPGVESFGSKASGSAAKPSYNNPPGIPGVNGLVPPPPPANGQSPDDEDDGMDVNQQAQKRAFLKARSEYSPYLNHTRENPLSQTELKAGSIIPGVMLSGVNSDLPGQIVGQVRQNVYDSASGRHLLIPAGARLVGTYDSSVSAGQERVLIAWNRVIFPDGSSLSLESMPGADRSGFAGMNDKVDNHYWRTFGNAFMLSLFSAGVQLSQPRGAVTGTYNSQQIMAAALGQQLGMLGMQTARRNLNIQPTLIIRPGYEFSIMITKDIILPPWRGHPLASSVSNVEQAIQNTGEY